jgi:hypothetical protein
MSLSAISERNRPGHGRFQFARRHVLSTRLMPADCEQRIRACAASWPMWRPTPQHPVAGTVSRTGFCLTKAIKIRNSFQTEARGTFTPAEQGTRIDVTLGPSPLVLAVGLVWLLLVLWFLAAGFAEGMLELAATGFTPSLLPLGMLLVGVATFAIGRLLARGEDAFLLRFLMQELEADEVVQANTLSPETL